MRQSLRRALVPAALAIALTALFLGHLARPGALLATRDVPVFHLPLRTALARAFATWPPVWDPAIHGGQPILSNPNYAAFYPPTWLAFFVPVHSAIGILILLHAILSFAGAFRLAAHLGCGRGPALFAGAGFAFSGASLATTTLLTPYCGLAWLPWVVLGALRWLDRSETATGRRRLLLPTIALALQILAGEPVMVLTTGLVVLTLALARPPRARRLARLAVICLLAALLAGVQVVPTLTRFADTPRSGGLADERSLAWSTSPGRALELVWPHAWGDPMRLDEGLFFGASMHDRRFPFLFSIYPGQLVVLLTLAALARWPIRYRWSWLLLAGGGLFLAAGAHNPVVAFAVRSLPALASIRYPEKFLLLTTSALAFAAALGWQHLLAARERPGIPLEDFPLALATVLAGFNALLLGVLAWRPDVAAWFARTRSALPATPELEARAVEFFRSELTTTLIVSCLAAGVFALHRHRRTASSVLVVATLALLVGDLFQANHRLTPIVAAADVLTPPRILAERDPSRGRLFTDRLFVGPPNMTVKTDRPGPAQLWSQVERADPFIATLWGFEYALNVDFDLMATVPARRALDELRLVWHDGTRSRRLLGAWSVRYLGFNRPVREILEARAQGREIARLRLEENPYYRPPVRFESRVVLHRTLEDALAAERSVESSGAHWVDLRLPDSTHVAGLAGARPEILTLSQRPATVELRYASLDPAPLTIARTFDRGWRATVDGSSVEIFETGLGMMGLLLPAGEHELELRFRQTGLASGVAASLAAVIILLFWARRRGGLESVAAE